MVKKARNNLNGHSSVFPAQGIGVVDDDIGGIDGEEAGGVLEQSFVGQGGFEKLRDESEEKENENDAGMRVEGGIELGEVKKVMDSGHDLVVIGEVDVEGRRHGGSGGPRRECRQHYGTTRAERMDRTRKGGMSLADMAFSGNFHVMGT